MLQKKEFKSRPPNAGMTGLPRRRRERSQPARLRLRRQSLPTGLPSPVTPRQELRRQSLPRRQEEDPFIQRLCGGKFQVRRQPSAHCPRGRRGHGWERRHDSPRSSHSSKRRRSGERSRPTSSGGSRSRARHTDPTDAPGSGRALGRATEVRPSSSATRHHRHQARSSPDRSTRSGSRQHDRRESVDSVRSGSSYLSRREVQLSPAVPQKTEKRTITVIPSPPRPAHTDDSAGVTGPADSAALADSAGVTGPADSAEANDSAGYESAGVSGQKWTSRRLCMTQQLWLTQHSIRIRQVTTQQAHRTQQATTRHFHMTQLGMARHNHKTRHVTTWQGVTGRQPRVLRQGLRQLINKTLPLSLMSAVSCSRLFRGTSTRQPYWTSCQCGLSCNEAWTGVWLETPSPGPLFRHRQLLMIILHLEDQRLQSGVPGLQTDNPRRPSNVPEGWMNPEIPHVLDLPLEGLPPQNLAPGILLQL